MRAILLASATATTLNGRRARSCVSHGYFLGCWRARRRTACAPTTRMRRKYRSPCLEIGPSFCLPPVESCRGTSPTQAAKSRPDRKAFGSVTVAVMALAPMRPIPGTLSSRLLASFARCCKRSRLSIEPIIVCSAWSCAASTIRLARASIGRRASFSSAMIFSNSLSPSCPCAATIPSSAKCARRALITCVRCRSSRSRARMLHQPALLLGRFRLHKSHRRPANRLADCLGVGRIVFVALDVGLHVFRRHQSNLVTELRQLACPVVRGGTSFHANQAGRQSCKKLHHLTAAKLLPDDDPLGRINSVDLEHVLGDIQTDCGNLHVDGSLMWLVATITLRRFVAGAGAVHHIITSIPLPPPIVRFLQLRT